MPSSFLPVAPYKGLFVLILVFVGLEYLFSTTSSNPKTELSNSTRQRTTSSNFIKTLISQQVQATVTEALKNKEFKAVNFSVTIHSRNTVTETLGTTMTESTTELPVCSDGTQYLYGRLEIIKDQAPTTAQLERRFQWLQSGGHWAPKDCRVNKKVAIVIPYRNRGEHLLLFLQHMHPFLKRQQLDYTIFVVEQDGRGQFNRAMLFNIGFVEAMKMESFDCFIFHDIDLLPEDDRNLYNCPEQPRHMSAAIDVHKYRIPYSGIFGGVSAITTAHFRLLNGFSNSFWGWGGEDDDMSNRIRYHKLHISRYPSTIARYTMLSHKKAKPSPIRYDVLKKGMKLFDKEGLTNLKYELLFKKKKLLYTWILARIESHSQR